MSHGRAGERPRAADPGHAGLPGRVVAVGGGHGLATTLRGLVGRVADLTAIVSVADDGGSSGRLRRRRGIVAPGDMRRCVEAMAADVHLAAASAHRFRGGDLDGHAAGNLWLAALLERHRDPVVAVETFARGLGARGHVLPATSEPVDLVARTATGPVVGQVAVSLCARRIESLATRPERPAVPAEALAAVAAADLVVLGPGSLFTSVLAAVTPALGEALGRARARIVLVANRGPQPGETDGYDLVDHVRAVVSHGVVPDVVVVDNDQRAASRALEEEMPGIAVLCSDVAAGDGRHDPDRLAAAVGAAAAVVSA